jgi:hypothetical protein
MQSIESKSEIARWTSEELRFVHRKEVLEAEVGAAMLDADSGVETTADERVARLLSEQRGCEVAIQTARQRRSEALQAKRAAEVKAIQDRRADLEKEQAALLGKVERHRKALVELLGIEITLVSVIPGRHSTVQSLAVQISGLDERVRRLEEPVPNFGMVAVDNVRTIDALIEALAAVEGVIPPLENVLAWAKACEPVPGEAFRDLPRNYRLFWTAAGIDTQQSSIFVESLCVPGPIGTYSNRPMGLNLQSGTFRATKPQSAAF